VLSTQSLVYCRFLFCNEDVLFVRRRYKYTTQHSILTVHLLVSRFLVALDVGEKNGTGVESGTARW